MLWLTRVPVTRSEATMERWMGVARTTRRSRRSGPAEDRAQPAEGRSRRSTNLSNDGRDTPYASGHCMCDLHMSLTLGTVWLARTGTCVRQLPTDPTMLPCRIRSITPLGRVVGAAPSLEVLAGSAEPPPAPPHLRSGLKEPEVLKWTWRRGPGYCGDTWGVP
jgi:hypothetical protein